MQEIILRLLQSFFEEDYGRGDVTSEALIPKDMQVEGQIVAKEDGIIAGLEEVLAFMIHHGLKVEEKARDGGRISNRQVVAKITGNARKMLSLERVCLNLLGHLSGVATATARAVSIAERAKKGVRVAATRKTTPGFRLLEKKAIELGGGDPHRLDLQDMVLIKNNHIALAGSVKKAVLLAKKRVSFSKKIEIEVSSMPDAIEAARAGADVIMLDNMRPAEIRNVVNELKDLGLRNALIEASGGVDFDNLAEYAKTGVDIVSMGMLTHSVKGLDFSMRIKPMKS